MNTSRRCLLLTFDENYLWPGLVALDSAIRHSPADVDVLVASIALEPESVARIQSICELHGRRVEIVEAADLVDGLPAGLPRFSPAAWTRVFLDVIVPPEVDRVVYLDGDTYTRRSLRPLFDLDLDESVLAAVPDPWEPHHQARGAEFWRAAGSVPSSAYFNSGVMVVDMEAWRKKAVTARVMETLTERAIPTRSVDQDALNAVLWRDWIPLAREWNLPGSSRRPDAGKARVVHFIGDSKPWSVRSRVGPFQREYRTAARRVGWTFRARWNTPLKTLARSVTPVWLLERFRWWRTGRSDH